MVNITGKRSAFNTQFWRVNKGALHGTTTCSTWIHVLIMFLFSISKLFMFIIITSTCVYKLIIAKYYIVKLETHFLYLFSKSHSSRGSTLRNSANNISCTRSLTSQLLAATLPNCMNILTWKPT